MARSTSKLTLVARAQKATAKGKHVIDLRDPRSTDERAAEYEAAFGLPSALHEEPDEAGRNRRGFLRLHRRR